MFDLPTATWGTFLAWAVVTIVVAVLANIATGPLQRAGSGCVKFFARVTTLGFRNIADLYFTEAARRPKLTSAPLILFLLLLMTLVAGTELLKYRYLLTMTPEEVQARERMDAAKPECTWTQVDFFSNCRVSKTTRSTNATAVAFAFSVVVALFGLRFMIVKQIIEGFDHAVAVLQASISLDEERELRSKFAQMTGAKDYREIRKTLQTLAERKQLQLPADLF